MLDYLKRHVPPSNILIEHTRDLHHEAGRITVLASHPSVSLQFLSSSSRYYSIYYSTLLLAFRKVNLNMHTSILPAPVCRTTYVFQYHMKYQVYMDSVTFIISILVSPLPVDPRDVLNTPFRFERIKRRYSFYLPYYRIDCTEIFVCTVPLSPSS